MRSLESTATCERGANDYAGLLSLQEEGGVEGSLEFEAVFCREAGPRSDREEQQVRVSLSGRRAVSTETMIRIEDLARETLGEEWSLHSYWLVSPVGVTVEEGDRRVHYAEPVPLEEPGESGDARIHFTAIAINGSIHDPDRDELLCCISLVDRHGGEPELRARIESLVQEEFGKRWRLFSYFSPCSGAGDPPPYAAAPEDGF